MTDHTPKKRRFRSPLDLGVEWLENRPPINAVYQRVALWVGIFGAVTGMLAAGLGWTSLKNQSEDNATLLSCFDKVLTSLTGSLPEVREASQTRNEALANVLIGDNEHLGLGLLIYRAQQGIKSDPKKDLADLAETFSEFQAADQHLIDVQRANPYPEAPSKFCELP